MSQEPFERKSGAYLPHWRQKGGVYFVTWRLADSLPLEMQEALKLEREIIESLEESQTTGKEYNSTVALFVAHIKSLVMRREEKT